MFTWPARSLMWGICREHDTNFAIELKKSSSRVIRKGFCNVEREGRDGALRRPRTSQRDVPTNRKQGKRIGLRFNYFRLTAKSLLLISEGSPAWLGALRIPPFCI
jgi:hypothetical protein